MTQFNKPTRIDHNQSPEFYGFNPYDGDRVIKRLCEGLPNNVRQSLSDYGKLYATPEAYELARLANAHTPQLKTHDAKGNRIDVVEYHPAYHALMRRSVMAGLNCSIWEDDPLERGNRNFVRGVKFMMTAGVESGHLCPITMTNASIATLAKSPQILEQWLPKIRTREYDSSDRPMSQKSGLTIGMGMTERQGGSDVRSNTTKAKEAGKGIWVINGQKWFFSAPMCDAFLILAQSEDGLDCFFMPRILPDGVKNGIEIQRLKDKVGNQSNASSEVEFKNSLAFRISEPGKGIASIMQMVSLTRLDCALSSAGMMRAALSEAVHHTKHRKAFGNPLIDQPLMTSVLADMSLDVAATSALCLRLAHAFDRADSDEGERAYARIMTPVVKYWVCKTAPNLIYECMECLGGNGYVNESNLARLYKEAPLNAIWEGSGNIQCLDVLRAMTKQPEDFTTTFQMIERDLQDYSSGAMDVIRAALDVVTSDQGALRILVEQLALTAAAAQLKSAIGGEVADAFIDSRLTRPWRATYGMMDSRYDAKNILKFCYPQIT